MVRTGRPAGRLTSATLDAVSEVRPPGWYADPSGEPGRLRWWDGSAWTGIDRARMPYEQQVNDGPGPDAVPVDLLGGEAGPPWSPRRWLAVLLTVAAIGGLVLIGRFPGLRGDRPPDRTLASQAPSTPAPAPTGEPAEPVPTGPSPTPSSRPVSGRVVDGTARLSYDVLPGSWRAWDLISFQGLVTTSGYYRLVQQRTPDGGEYWANVTSGPVNPNQVGADLRGTARRLAGTLDGLYYPPAHTRREVVERATTVDGRAAYLVRWLAVFDPRRTAGYLARSEVVAVLVVDVGRDQPSVLYLSLPDPVRTVWPSVDSVLGSVRVLP